MEPWKPCALCPRADGRCRGRRHTRDCENVAAEVADEKAGVARAQPTYWRDWLEANPCDEPLAAGHLGLAGRNPLLEGPGPRREPPEPIGPERSEVVLITGGTGDFLTLDSYMAPAYRDGIRQVLLATPAAASIRALMEASPAWRHAAIDSLWGDWSKRSMFVSLAEVRILVPDPRLEECADWSIARIFHEIEARKHPFWGSSFLRHELAEIEGLGLPERFVAIHPATVSPHRNNRFFTRAEWAWTLTYLRSLGLPGVVIGVGGDPVPEAPELVNLVGRTTYPESVEVLKRAEGFVGIDSAPSVLAAQLFRQEKIHVRSTQAHAHRWARIYYAPHKRLPFFRRRLDLDPLAGYAWTPDGDLELCDYGIARQADRTHRVAYDQTYFDHYVGLESGDMAGPLNMARVSLARRYSAGVLDVGIGAGTFLECWPASPRFGYDVNPAGVDWLKARGLFADPWKGLPEGVGVVTFWDSLEHMEAPGELLGRLPEGVHVCLSLPIFPELGSIRASKHYKPGEHLTYWTAEGLGRWMKDMGYAAVYAGHEETRLGREGIGTFVFKRGPRPCAGCGGRQKG